MQSDRDHVDLVFSSGYLPIIVSLTGWASLQLPQFIVIVYTFDFANYFCVAIPGTVRFYILF